MHLAPRPSARSGTYRVGLIGSGIARSLTPALHEREAERAGLSYRYDLIDLAARRLTTADVPRLVAEARDAGFTGLNITHPAKSTVIPYLDALDPRAATVGAVNTVLFTEGRAIGHNTDLPGFARNLTRGLPGAVRTRVVLLGAGGAGAAVAHALLELGTRELTVLDAEPARADGLATALRETYGDRTVFDGPPSLLPEALATANGLINATPVGGPLHPGLPLDGDLLRPELWVADLVYRPLTTRLLRAARASGCRTLDGGGMAVFQAAEAFRLFTGMPADTGRMLAHFADLVAEEETR